jgi:hypothetical protein
MDTRVHQLIKQVVCAVSPSSNGIAQQPIQLGLVRVSIGRFAIVSSTAYPLWYALVSAEWLLYTAALTTVAAATRCVVSVYSVHDHSIC